MAGYAWFLNTPEQSLGKDAHWSDDCYSECAQSLRRNFDSLQVDCSSWNFCRLQRGSCRLFLRYWDRAAPPFTIAMTFIVLYFVNYDNTCQAVPSVPWNGAKQKGNALLQCNGLLLLISNKHQWLYHQYYLHDSRPTRHPAAYSSYR